MLCEEDSSAWLTSCWPQVKKAQAHCPEDLAVVVVVRVDKPAANQFSPGSLHHQFLQHFASVADRGGRLCCELLCCELLCCELWWVTLQHPWGTLDLTMCVCA